MTCRVSRCWKNISIQIPVELLFRIVLALLAATRSGYPPIGHSSWSLSV